MGVACHYDCRPPKDLASGISSFPFPARSAQAPGEAELAEASRIKAGPMIGSFTVHTNF